MFGLHRIGLTVLACAAVSVAGCADTRGGAIPYQVSDFRPPDSTVAAPLEGAYRIAPMDVLTIQVFGMPNISGEYPVDLRGNVAMPLIGEVAAIDMTPAQLKDMLTARFGEKYLENPDVTVGVKEAKGHSVTVDGAVKKPGSYPVVGPMTLMQAVALAEGLDEFANARRVAIFRTIGGQRQAAAFDLTSIRRGEMDDPTVYTGDIVIVDGSKNKEFMDKFLKTFPLFSIFRPF